jgi:hypothetical protein
MPAKNPQYVALGMPKMVVFSIRIVIKLETIDAPAASVTWSFSHLEHFEPRVNNTFSFARGFGALPTPVPTISGEYSAVVKKINSEQF